MKTRVYADLRGRPEDLAVNLPEPLAFLLNGIDRIDETPEGPICFVMSTLNSDQVEMLLAWGRERVAGRSRIGEIRLEDVYEQSDLHGLEIVELFVGSDGINISVGGEVLNLKKALELSWTCEVCNRLRGKQIADFDIKIPKGLDLVTTPQGDWVISPRVQEIFERMGVSLRPLKKGAYKQIVDIGLYDLSLSTLPIIELDEICPGCNKRSLGRRLILEGLNLNAASKDLVVMGDSPISIIKPEQILSIAQASETIMPAQIAPYKVHEVGEKASLSNIYHYNSQTPVYFASAELVYELLEMGATGFNFRPVTIVTEDGQVVTPHNVERQDSLMVTKRAAENHGGISMPKPASERKSGIVATKPPSALRSSIRIPTHAQITFFVYCNLPNDKAPTDTEEINIPCLPWVAKNVDEPLTDIVSQVIEADSLSMVFAQGNEIDLIAAALSFRVDRSPVDTTSFRYCAVFHCFDMLRFPRPGLWTPLATAMFFAEQNGGILVDGSARLPFPADVPFRDLHVDAIPRMRYFVSTHYAEAQGNGQCMTTAGMDKFGLPELQIAGDIPPSLVELCAQLLLATCQVLFCMVMNVGYDITKPAKSVSVPKEVTLPLTFFNLALGRPDDPRSDEGGVEFKVRLQFETGIQDAHRECLTVCPPKKRRSTSSEDFRQWLDELSRMLAQ